MAAAKIAAIFFAFVGFKVDSVFRTFNHINLTRHSIQKKYYAKPDHPGFA